MVRCFPKNRTLYGCRRLILNHRAPRCFVPIDRAHRIGQDSCLLFGGEASNAFFSKKKKKKIAAKPFHSLVTSFCFELSPALFRLPKPPPRWVWGSWSASPVYLLPQTLPLFSSFFSSFVSFSSFYSLLSSLSFLLFLSSFFPLGGET